MHFTSLHLSTFHQLDENDSGSLELDEFLILLVKAHRISSDQSIGLDIQVYTEILSCRLVWMDNYAGFF